jgi:glycosyltransferase involved in cell wall biosynthesis
MENQISLSIIIPVFNEENNLTPLYSELTDVLRKLNI